MGLYATTSSISELVPRFLTGNTTTSDTAGTSAFSRHIDRAESLVNASVGVFYDVSAFTSGAASANVPPLLRTLSEDIATYYATRASHVQDGQRRQTILNDYTRSLDDLSLIRDGKLKLTYTNGSEVPTRASGRYLTTTDYPQVFNLDDEEKWGVDSDQESAIEADRG